MKRTVRSAVLVAIATSGCFSGGSSVSCGGPHERGVPFDHGATREDPGPVLVRLESGASFVYTPDESEIVYSAYAGRHDEATGAFEPAYVLRAVRLSDGATRALSDAPMAWADAFALTPDGAALYFLANDASSSTGSVLREAYAGADLALEGRAPLSFLLSTDAVHLLVQTARNPGFSPVEVVEVDRATGTAEVTPCSSTAGAAFSPAGDEVMCGRSTGDGWALIRYRFQDRSVRQLAGLSRCVGDPVSRWTRDGIVIACSAPDGTLVLGDPETGTELGAVPGVGGAAGGGAFSADGAEYAFTIGTCLAGFSTEDGACVIECSRWENQVSVFELRTGATAAIATSAFYPGALAFSADGATLSYLIDGAVHVRPTGR